MKLHLSTCCLVLAVLPTLGMAQTRRAPPPIDTALSVLPVATDNTEARSALSLRESLRQPLDDADNKPFRLSSEERQRMREQLRSQSALYETSKR